MFVTKCESSNNARKLENERHLSSVSNCCESLFGAMLRRDEISVRALHGESSTGLALGVRRGKRATVALPPPPKLSTRVSRPNLSKDQI